MKRNDLPVTQYLQQVMLIVGELAAVKITVHPSTLNASIFNNLGPEFFEVVSTLVVHGGDPFSFAKLSSTLTSHKTRLNHNKSMELAMQFLDRYR